MPLRSIYSPTHQIDVNRRGESGAVVGMEQVGGADLSKDLDLYFSVSDKSGIVEFARGAAVVLKRRVHNAMPARNEQRWLAGWLKRVNSYTRD